MAITRAAACAALASSSSSFLVSPTVSETASSGLSRRRSTAARAPATFQQSLVVKCEQRDDIKSIEVNFNRRKVFSLAALSLVMAAGNAQAKDVPLFGFKKQLESAKKAVDTSVQGLEGVTSSVQETLSGIEAPSVSGLAPSVSGLSPVVQAGAVVGAELVAVVVASSVVSGLVSVPSKEKRGK